MELDRSLLNTLPDTGNVVLCFTRLQIHALPCLAPGNDPLYENRKAFYPLTCTPGAVAGRQFVS